MAEVKMQHNNSSGGGEHEDNLSLMSIMSFLFLAAVSVVVMVYGQSVIIPIIIAIAICFVLGDIINRVGRIRLFGYSLPDRITKITTVIIIAIVIIFFARLFFLTANSFVQEFPVYRSNLDRLIEQVPPEIWELVLGSDVNAMVVDFDQLFQIAADYLSGLVTIIAGQLVNILVQALIVFFYVLFLMQEQGDFSGKIRHMFPDARRRQETEEIINSIGEQVRKYLAVKTYVSFLTGLGSFVIMLLFGLDFAIFWAILIFILNYIPYVGSIVAVLFPVTLALLQFGAIGPFLGLLILLLAIQVAVGYVIEPMVMGNSLDISPFVVLASLSVFSAIWGITGMIVAVPIVIVLIIVFSHFDVTRPVAILLSGKGVVYGVHQHAELNTQLPAQN